MRIEVLNKTVCGTAVSIKEESKTIGTAFKSIEKNLKEGDLIEGKNR